MDTITLLISAVRLTVMWLMQVGRVYVLSLSLPFFIFFQPDRLIL